MSVGDLFIGLCATPLIVFGACLWPPEVVPKEADIGGLARTIGAGTSIVPDNNPPQGYHCIESIIMLVDGKCNPSDPTQIVRV